MPTTYKTLGVLAALVDDLESVRKASENRIRTLVRDAREEQLITDRGADNLSLMLKALELQEKAAVRELERAMKDHPLGPWVEGNRGMGLKTIARLLAATGDPYMRNILESDGDRRWKVVGHEPRTVSQLWAYVGVGDPTRQKRKGMTQSDLFALGNPTAKMRLHLVAERAMQSGIVHGKAVSHWGEVYLKCKAANEGKLHSADVPCAQCTPKGKPPADPGTPWRDGHRHASALRILGKEILKDMWIAAREIHEQADGLGQHVCDAHMATAESV